MIPDERQTPSSSRQAFFVSSSSDCLQVFRRRIWKEQSWQVVHITRWHGLNTILLPCLSSLVEIRISQSLAHGTFGDPSRSSFAACLQDPKLYATVTSQTAVDHRQDLEGLLVENQGLPGSMNILKYKTHFLPLGRKQKCLCSRFRTPLPLLCS